jgi:hypothetical protein
MLQGSLQPHTAMTPWLATKEAASSRAARTILSSRRDEEASEVASDEAASDLTTASVVTTKLVALAVPAKANNVAKLRVRIAVICKLLIKAQQTV